MSDDDLIISPTADPELVKHTDDHVTDTPMRERLARACCFASECCFSRDKPCSGVNECDTWELELSVVDAILTELESPSEGMLEAARDWSIAKYGQAVGNDGATGCMRAMIQHIKDGGQ